MAKVIDTVSLTIEVESGKDQAGDSIFKKKTFGNVKSDVNVDSLAAVATAIKQLQHFVSQKYPRGKQRFPGTSSN